jgi:hypothetical protein
MGGGRIVVNGAKRRRRPSKPVSEEINGAAILGASNGCVGRIVEGGT